jgi:hypothetical protein
MVNRCAQSSVWLNPEVRPTPQQFGRKHWVIVQIAIPLYKKPLRIRGECITKDVRHSKRKRPFGRLVRRIFFHEQDCRKNKPLPRRRAVCRNFKIIRNQRAHSRRSEVSEDGVVMCVGHSACREPEIGVFNSFPLILLAALARPSDCKTHLTWHYIANASLLIDKSIGVSRDTPTKAVSKR